MGESAPQYEGLAGQLVVLTRASFRERPHEGFLVAGSDQWLVLHSVSDRLDLDGFRCFRTRDVTGLSTTAGRLDLVRRALELKGLTAGDPGPLDLSSTRGLLLSIQAGHGAVTIDRERITPDACEIGRIRLAAELTYTLHWLSIHAQWEPDGEVFRYDDITQLQFGGEYETTLLALAGEPPASVGLPDTE